MTPTHTAPLPLSGGRPGAWQWIVLGLITWLALMVGLSIYQTASYRVGGGEMATKACSCPKKGGKCACDRKGGKCTCRK